MRGIIISASCAASAAYAKARPGSPHRKCIHRPRSLSLIMVRTQELKCGNFDDPAKMTDTKMALVSRDHAATSTAPSMPCHARIIVSRTTRSRPAPLVLARRRVAVKAKAARDDGGRGQRA